jgi:hypothetical protein
MTPVRTQVRQRIRPPHAEMMTSTPKVVVSTTLANPDWGPTMVISSNAAAELILNSPALLVRPVLASTAGTCSRAATARYRSPSSETRPHSNGVVALRYAGAPACDGGSQQFL